MNESTSASTGHRVEPGWYADPEGLGLRYWDGDAWTEHRTPAAPPPTSAPPAASVPPTAPTVVPAGMRRKQRFRLAPELDAEERRAFLAYLDSLPESQRPVYGFVGLKTSLRKKVLGGGAKHMVVLVFPDHLVLSRRGMGSLTKESRREIRSLSDLTDVRVTDYPLFSNVRFSFGDGSTFEVSDVEHEAAVPMARFATQGLPGLERANLGEKALTGFWQACSHGLPIPE